MKLIPKPRLTRGTYCDPLMGFLWTWTWFCSAEADGSCSSVGMTPKAAYEAWVKHQAWKYEPRRPWWKFWGGSP